MDARPRRRIRDPQPMRALHLTADECCVCGVTWPLNAGHVLSRARGGDDVAENLVPICGSGTTGCHGKQHAGDEEVKAAIGRALTPAHISYLLERLGESAGREFLRREYLLEIGAT